MAKNKMPVEKLTKAIPVKIVSDNVPSIDHSDRERKYKAEDALRDIQRAKKHEQDKELMRDVKKLAKEQVNSLKKIC